MNILRASEWRIRESNSPKTHLHVSRTTTTAVWVSRTSSEAETVLGAETRAVHHKLFVVTTGARVRQLFVAQANNNRIKIKKCAHKQMSKLNKTKNVVFEDAWLHPLNRVGNMKKIDAPPPDLPRKKSISENKIAINRNKSQ